MSYGCATCGFKLYIPVARLGVSWLGLYDDDRYPGRCLVVLDQHKEVWHHLDHRQRNAFMRDTATASKAIEAVTGTARINMAVLGNTEPHLHAHLIPRVASGDPVPERPHWEDPRKRTPLAGDDVTKLVAKLRLQLRS